MRCFVCWAWVTAALTFFAPPLAWTAPQMATVPPSVNSGKPANAPEPAAPPPDVGGTPVVPPEVSPPTLSPDDDPLTLLITDPNDPAAAVISAQAERIFSRAQPRLIQIRTVVRVANQQAAIGSGFLVDKRGLALTNYHVVSRFALQPKVYELQYVSATGDTGSLELLAVDVVNDLAVLRLNAPADATFQAFDFDRIALAGKMVKGDRLFAMGNPRDLGFTIVEGTYNGLVEKSYQPRIHFTGALNPGMSGGPAVNRANRIVGVNVSKRVNDDLVSFLVPASAANNLLKKARDAKPVELASMRKVIAKQLNEWQSTFFAALTKAGFRQARFGDYSVGESAAPWFGCWASTNRNASDPPRTLMNRSTCNTGGRLFLAEDMETGHASLSHTLLTTKKLNAMQFATEVSRIAQPNLPWGSPLRFTPYRCVEEFIGASDDNPTRPVSRATWCARAYRDFPNLYDISFVNVTQNKNRSALISQLTLRGFDYGNAVAYTKDFLNTLHTVN
jgi:S1-C subfamily serine protease